MTNKNLSANQKSYFCGFANITAGGTGDNTKVTGLSIDTQNYEGGKLILAITGALADTETLKLAVEYQDSANNSTWATAVSLQASTTALLGTAAAEVGNTIEFDIDLSSKQRYIRFNFTPLMSATDTDTATTTAIFVASGAVENPITKSV